MAHLVGPCNNSTSPSFNPLVESNFSCLEMRTFS
jgi:hypothetical protein